MYRQTLQALLTPRRIVPFVLVCSPLLIAQTRLSEHISALPLGALMSVAFLLLAPFLFRVFRPTDAGPTRAAVKLLAYAACGAVIVGSIGMGLTELFHVPVSFMTARETLWVVLAMFWVGGWGLGRDIDHEIGLHTAQANTARALEQLSRTQVLAVQRHLDPHFLFNTLNAIAEWCRDDPEVAERAILALSDLLRELLDGIKLQAWPLHRELALVRGVVELHRIRDPGCFVFDEQIGVNTTDVEVPPLLLLPMIENAMKHGPGAGHRGRVRLSIQQENKVYHVRLSNPGGFGGARHGGEGLALVRKRVEMCYANSAVFAIAGDGKNTVAQLHIPRQPL